jgi:hypothetical protein
MTLTKTDLRTELLRVIKRQAGPDQAITAGRLSTLFSLNERVIRLAIRELRKTEPVLSNTKGYYWPENQKQIDGFLAAMRGRLIEDALTRRDVRLSGQKWAAAQEVPPVVQGRLM